MERDSALLFVYIESILWIEGKLNCDQNMHFHMNQCNLIGNQPTHKTPRFFLVFEIYRSPSVDAEILVHHLLGPRLVEFAWESNVHIQHHTVSQFIDEQRIILQSKHVHHTSILHSLAQLMVDRFQSNEAIKNGM